MRLRERTMTEHEDDDVAVLDAITDEEAEAAAQRDPDSPELTEDEEWSAGLRREVALATTVRKRCRTTDVAVQKL